MDINNDIIAKIIELEWDMFQAVNEGGPRASCQEDRVTFDGMRRGQFVSWDTATLESYFDDLNNAILDGRNLIAEKYIHMMKNPDPAQYEQLLQTIPPVSDLVRALAQAISDKMIEQTITLQQKYPYVSGSGRPLRSVSDLTGVTSIETYQLSELLTYSDVTLQSLLAHLTALEADGLSLPQVILENTVKHYGFKSLEAAEAASKKSAEAQGVEITIGCEDCNTMGNL